VPRSVCELDASNDALERRLIFRPYDVGSSSVLLVGKPLRGAGASCEAT